MAPEDPAFTETTRSRPNSPYSASKAGSDHLVRAYQHTYGLQVTTSNCSNNYGPYHFPEKLIPLCLTRILDGGVIPVYGDGSNIRDWLFVEDHARGIRRILDRHAGGGYNIGGHNEWANLDFREPAVPLMDERFANHPRWRHGSPNAPIRGERSDSLMSSSRTARARLALCDRCLKNRAGTGLCPNETFQTGLAKTIDWYLANGPGGGRYWSVRPRRARSVPHRADNLPRTPRSGLLLRAGVPHLLGFGQSTPTVGSPGPGEISLLGGIVGALVRKSADSVST
ncbi:MAG: hypothetical protein CM15mP25_0710 [Gammaproteobacteria bacterium]|nr:MAG: hypothetical protein CM15mP25_0710 [Gammaproteobacteria bacterium]